MNKLISKIVGVALGLTLAVGTGVAVATNNKSFSKAEAADSLAYTIQSKANSSDSDASTEITSGVDNLFVDAGTYVSSASAAKVYLGKSSTSALKFGSSSAKGTLTITLATSGQVKATKVVFSIAAANDSNKKVNLSLNGAISGTGYSQITTGSVSGTFSDYTVNWDGSTNLSSIKVEANAASKCRFYLKNIKVYVAGGSDVYPTSISCSNQSVDVISTVNLNSKVTFTPNTTTVTSLSYAIKSGSDYIDLDADNGIVTGKKSGTAVVTITPDSTGGASAIDVNITVNAIAVSAVTIGNQYSIYSIDSGNNYNAELSGVVSNLGTVESFTGSVPPSNTLWTAEEGYYENTIAFKNGSSYLSLTAGSNNLNSEASITKNSSWIVNWDSSTEAATLTNAFFTNRSLKFNFNSGTNMRFACYTSGQTDILLHEFVNKDLTDFTIDASISVYKTGTATIGVTYTPADASDKTLSWSSDDTSIATVDSNGVVTGVAVGTTTVTAYKVIDEVNVERTCTVTVLNNKAAHLGTSADPFDINDAVNVAKGIIVETSNGTAIDLASTYYYVEGIITKADSRTTTNLTVWIGDNAQQISASTGALQIYKAAKIYGTNLADYYTENSEAARDFAVGYTIKASGKLKNYNGTPEMDTGGYIYYNNYIEARKYAEAFNTALEAVCDADGNTVATDLESAWSAQATAYAALDATLEQPILKNATAKTTSSATAVELCAAKYDYILGKYGTTTLSNFIARTVSPSSANVRFAALANNNTALVVVVITAFVGVTFIGGYFFLRKKKEN